MSKNYAMIEGLSNKFSRILISSIRFLKTFGLHPEEPQRGPISVR